MPETSKKYLSPKEVEELFNIPATILEKWRYRKVGPEYLKLGKLVRYQTAEVEAWIERHKVRTMN